jgi:methionyl-tRNA synthetase
MSKSLGNVVEPLVLKNVYGLDAFRYFLMREMVFGLDSSFSEAALVQRINSDLANDLGNLFSRVIAMTQKYFGGVVPESTAAAEERLSGLKFGSLAEAAAAAIDHYETAMAHFAFHKGLIAVWEFINQMNKVIDVAAPWELAKQKACRPELEAVLYQLLEGLRIVSGLIYPVMPETARKMQAHLGLSPDAPFYRFETLRAWKTLPPGVQLPKSTRLFPRIDPDTVKTGAAGGGGTAADTEAAQTAPLKPVIDIETFAKIDLRVATVVKAEPVPKARKLLKLEVDMGEKRTIVSGISESYQPDELVGKQVIIVANLKPAKLMGVLSQGMLLAAAEEKAVTVATLDKAVKPGTMLS